MALTANAVSYIAIGGSIAQAVPVGATNSGAPVVPDSYAIVTPPTAGTAVASASGITYQPTDGSLAINDSFTYTVTLGGVTSAPATVGVSITATYNCACDDADFPTATLSQLQRRVLVRLGKAAMSQPGPGMAELVNDFLNSAQTFLYRKYQCMRTERFFTWQMVPGQRFFDFDGNIDACPKKLDPRQITWAGISQGDNNWIPLAQGISPQNYSPKYQGMPALFEIRQCIEVWPAANDASWLLRIKGQFSLLPFSDPGDVTTIDAEAVFLYALATAKAHYGQADAGNALNACLEYIGLLNAGSYPTKRAWPGANRIPNAVPPKMVQN